MSDDYERGKKDGRREVLDEIEQFFRKQIARLLDPSIRRTEVARFNYLRGVLHLLRNGKTLRVR